jgi:N-acetylneuraminic acid mutarotase
MKKIYLKPKSTLLLLAILSAAWTNSNFAQDGEGGWTLLESMSTERTLHASCFLNGKIYIIGGAKTGMVNLGSTEVYNISLNKWTSLQNLNTTRMGHTAETVNGKIYAIGGKVGEIISNVEEYDPVEDTWIKKSDMPENRRLHSSCVINDTIYIIGGYSTETAQSLASCLIYIPASDSWDTIGSLNNARSSASCCLYNGKIYVFGGIESVALEMVKTVEVYDPNTDDWTILGSMPFSLSFHDNILDENNGQVLFFGGSYSFDAFDYNDRIFGYNLKTSEFKTMNFMHKMLCPAAELVDNYIYLIGGEPIYKEVISDTVWKFNLDYLTGIKDYYAEPEFSFSLRSVNPNPFSGSTLISYELTTPGKIQLDIYNCLGKKINKLVNEVQYPGNYEVEWNAEGIKSGIYFCRLQVDSYSQTQKLIVSQ